MKKRYIVAAVFVGLGVISALTDDSTQASGGTMSLITANLTEEAQERIDSQRYPVVDPDSGFFVEVNPRWIREPFGDYLQGEGWEIANREGTHRVRVVGFKQLPNNRFAIMTEYVFRVSRLTAGPYRGLYNFSEPSHGYGVRVFDTHGNEYAVTNRNYGNETIRANVQRYFDQGVFTVGSNMGRYGDPLNEAYLRSTAIYLQQNG